MGVGRGLHILVTILVMATDRIHASTLPEDFRYTPDASLLTDEETSILNTLKDHLDGSLKNYQRDLHTSYSRQSQEYASRIKRETVAVQEQYWNIDAEEPISTDYTILKQFYCSGDDYIILGYNRVAQGIYFTDAEIYKFHPLTRTFNSTGVRLSTYGVADIEPLLIAGRTYIVIGNGQWRANDFEGLSQIFSFDPTIPAVDHVQYIYTYGVSALDSFIYEGDTYLCIANHRVNRYIRYYAPTKIYIFKESYFDEVASVDLYYAKDIAGAILGFDAYIAIAQYMDNEGDYTLGTILYRLAIGTDANTGDTTFELVKEQVIPSSGPQSITFFKNKAHNYLAIANSITNTNGAPDYEPDCIIYWWTTDSQFIQYQVLPTYRARKVEYLELENEPNLLLTADLDGLQFYHFNEAAEWELSETVIFGDPDDNSEDLSIEFFNMDNEDFIAITNATFSTVPGAPASNLFSFSFVNLTTYENVTAEEEEEVYLPACAQQLAEMAGEAIRNVSIESEYVGRGISKNKGQQVISSTIVLTGHVQIPRLETRRISIESGQQFELDPNMLETLRNNTNLIEELEIRVTNFVTKSTNQTIVGPVTFTGSQISVTETTTANEFTASDAFVNGLIDLQYIDDFALRTSGNQSFFEPVEFTDDLTVGTYVITSGYVNDIDIPSDVMSLDGAETVDGFITFSTSDVTFNDAVTVDQYVNDLDLSVDLVLMTQSANVTGNKTFSQGITLENAMEVREGNTVDSVDVSEFAYQVLRASTGGTVNGNTTFESPVVFEGDVNVENEEFNGINIVEIYNDTVFRDEDHTITASKFFARNLETRGDIGITGTVNDIDLSESVFRLSSNQPILSNMTVIGGGLSITGNVNVATTVNGVDLSEEAVLENTTQVIIGSVVFTEDIEIEGNISVGPETRINDVDISEYAATAVRINEDSIIGGVKTFTNVITAEELEVLGDINGVDIEDLYDDILSISRDQVFPVAVDIEGNVLISGDATLASTIDGLVIPDDLIALGSQTFIYGHKTFSDLVDVGGDITMNSNTLNGQDLSEFDTQILKNVGDQTLPPSITFNSATTISGNVTVTGAVNSYTIPNDFVLLEGTQIITGTKTFLANVQADYISASNLQVDGLIDSVDIDSLYSDALMVDDGGACNITGSKMLSSITVNGVTTVSGTIDGVDLVAFNASAVFLSLDNTIAGAKTFTSPVSFSNDVQVNLVEGSDFSDLSATVIYHDTRGEIRGVKTFTSGLNVTGYMDVEGLVNGVNITLLDETYLSRQYEQILDGTNIFTSEITIGTLILTAGKTLDGIEPAHFLLLHGNEHFNEHVTFRDDVDIAGDATVLGTINTVNITELHNTAVWLTGPAQIVSGTKTFPSITVYNDIVIDTGLVDGVDVSDLASKVLDSSVDNEISIATTISGTVTVTGDLQTDANIGGVNIGYLLDDTIVLDEDFNITDTWIFASSADVTMNSLTFKDDLALDVLLDQTLLEDFMNAAVLLSTNQTIDGSVVFNDDIDLLNGLDINGLTDGIDISEHAVLKSTNQRITGCTRFSVGFRVNADISVGGNVDGADLDTLIAERVTYSTEQNITGTWTFGNLTADGNITIEGTLNNIDVGDDLVTAYQNEVITGTKNFMADMIVLGDLDTAEINGVDIVELANSVVLTEGSSIIDGEKTFNSALTMNDDTDVTGLVNCVDVGLLSSKFTNKAVFLNSSVEQLSDSLTSQCEATATMQSSLGEHPLLLTHWVDYQQIQNPAAGKFHSLTLEGGNTLLALSETYKSAVDRCIVTELYLCPADWPSCISVLDEPLPPSVHSHLYQYKDDVFIVLLPSQQSGQCAGDHDQDLFTKIFMLKDLSYNVTLLTPHATGVTMFEIADQLFMAVAKYKNPVTHDTTVNSTIFVWNNSTASFDVFQEIETHGAYAVSHLSWEGFTWLCFANNVLDNKSPIFVYDDITDQFIKHVEEGTNHASAVSMFLMDNVPFVAISSEKLIGDSREAEFHREITILSYQNHNWVMLESIASYGILDTTVFAIDNFLYLAGDSFEDGILSIYEWHHAGMFELYQSLPLTNQYDAHAFVHQGEIMMAVARPAFTPADIFSWDTKILKAIIRGKTSSTMLRAW